MSKWNGKSQANVLGYQILYYIMKYAGIGTVYFILRFVALYFLIFSRYASKCQWYYFRKRWNQGIFKSIFSMYQNYYLFGQTLVDRVYMISGMGKKFTFQFDGEEHITNMLTQGKGAFLISGHAGNWEIAGYLLHRIPAKINIVIFEAEHESVKTFLDGVKGKTHVNLIAVNNDSIDHIYKINEAIEKNEIVCIHADRFVAGSPTTDVDFLGAKAAFPTGPFILTTRLNAPLSFVYAMKEGRKHYHFFASEPIVAKSNLGKVEKQAEVHQLVKDYVHSLENILHAYPQQWFNYYQFWNK